MNRFDVDTFMSEVETALRIYFTKHKIVFLIRTAKSLKAKVYLDNNRFIALR